MVCWYLSQYVDNSLPVVSEYSDLSFNMKKVPTVNFNGKKSSAFRPIISDFFKS